MVIKKVSSREYASVNAESVERYIRQYSNEIQELVFCNDANGDCESRPLRELNKAQLNSIASELETVVKRLRYELYGEY